MNDEQARFWNEVVMAYPKIFLEKLRKIRKTSVRTVNNVVEIWLNTSLDYYRYANLLNTSDVL
jgi:hypothetical protein